MKYDVVILGSGIAGLWLLNALSDRGFSVLLIEKNVLGGVQTMASQGMLHGGQRYLLAGNTSVHADLVAAMPARWDACLAGQGDLDLRGVRTLAEHQVMWPAGWLLARAGLHAAVERMQSRMKKMEPAEYPAVFAAEGARWPMYELPEKVLDVRSLVSVLANRHGDRIRKGEVRALGRDGRMDISGVPVEARLVISAAGLGNEDVLRLVGADDASTQRRPLRQIMVKTLPYPLYGHGVVYRPRPRVTVTSYPVTGGYLWYLGGEVAERATLLSEEAAIEFAKKEMRTLFPHLDWPHTEWATWSGVRAEARSDHGRLPGGPALQSYGKVLIVWPTKLTLAPLLADHVLSYVEKSGMRPTPAAALPALPAPPVATLPWENASWVS